MILKIRDNLLMLSLEAEDAPKVYKVIDNNRNYLRKWLPWVDGTDSSAVIENVINKWENQRVKGSDIVFGIFMDGEYIGNIGLHDIDLYNKKAIIGYWLAEDFQGSGVMTDCVRTLVKHAFDTLELNSISIHCALDNNKSRAIPERLGFIESGILKNGEILYGIPHDMVIYSLERLRLVFPTLDMEREALDYRQEHIDYGETHIHGSGGFIKAEDYKSWLEKITNALTAIQTNWVNCSTYFAVIGNRIVGTIQIRHSLNEFLLGYGGHIGYGVRPFERRKGYATEMLRLALGKCHELGIEKALVTCDNDNIGSMRTIIKNGGILENEVPQKDGTVLQRYWISIAKS